MTRLHATPQIDSIKKDFAAEGCDLFGKILGREMQDGFRPELEGKSLGDIILKITWHNSDSAPSFNHIGHRALEVYPYGQAPFDVDKETHATPHIEQETAEYLGKVILHKAKFSQGAKEESSYFDGLSAVGNWVNVEYLPTGSPRVSTFQKRPSRFGLNNARSFIEDSMAYVADDEAFFGYMNLKTDAIWGRTVEPDSGWKHWYTFNLNNADLALNGFEDTEFTKEFYVKHMDEMVRIDLVLERQIAKAYESKAKMLNNPEYEQILVKLSEQRDAHENAINRARKFMTKDDIEESHKKLDSM